MSTYPLQLGAATGHARSRIWVAVGALAALLAAFIFAGYRHDIGEARARVSSGSKVVNTACGPIEYADVGTGPAILAIHGAGGGFDQSLDLAQAFLKPGFRLTAPSRFGYLRTPLPPDTSPPAQADAHACLLDTLHLEKAAVIGVSMGAPSAMQFCLRHPDRCSALVLLVPIAFAPRTANQPQRPPSVLAQFLMDKTLKSDFVFWAASKLARDAMMKTILATPPADFRNASSAEQEPAMEVLRHILPISQREKGLRSDGVVAPSIPRYELEQFRVPTLVISAEDDLFGTFRGGRFTAEHIPGARFVGYPTGGHLLLGHTADVQAEVADFLRKQTAAERP